MFFSVFDRSIEEERLRSKTRRSDEYVLTRSKYSLYSFFCVVSFILHRFCCYFFYENDTPTGASFNVKTFNAIAPTGLEKFPRGKYEVAGEENDLPGPPMAIMLRSHKLQVSEVKPTVRAIVRCGAGTNNIPVKEMGERGIPVFNTPGANANAVKELVVCGLLLASRGILEGANHVKNVINVEEKGEHEKIATRIEKDKANFGGKEIQGKTIGVIGLGAIGSRCVFFFL